MRGTVGLGLVFGVLASSSAGAQVALNTYNGVIVDSPALPGPGTIRLYGEAGTFGLGDGVAVLVSGSWVFAPGFAVVAGGTIENGGLLEASPSLALRCQPLSQITAGIDLALMLRGKTSGFDPMAAEVEFGASLGRTIGKLQLAAGLTQGVGLDGGLDTEGSLAVLYPLGSIADFGLEGRYRTGKEPDPLCQQS